MHNLAIRGAMFGASGGGVPTARDYVQEGLVFQLDCRENIGFGQFSASATSWKNLVGSDSATFSGTRGLTWSLDGCLFLGHTYLESIVLPVTSFDIKNIRTFELCYMTLWHTRYSRIMGTDNMGYVTDYTGNFGILNNTTNNNESGAMHIRLGNNTDAQIGSSLKLPEVGVKCSCAFAYSSVNDFVFFVNNEKSTTAAYKGVGWGTVPTGNNAVKIPQRDYDRNSDLVIYEVRGYDRKITDYERAENFTVDKARFNLPG